MCRRRSRRRRRRHLDITSTYSLTSNNINTLTLNRLHSVTCTKYELRRKLFWNLLYSPTACYTLSGTRRRWGGGGGGGGGGGRIRRRGNKKNK